jgi:hypothetical protein
MLEHGLNKVTLAQNLGKTDGVVRRMIDLDPPDQDLRTRKCAVASRQAGCERGAWAPPRIGSHRS